MSRLTAKLMSVTRSCKLVKRLYNEFSSFSFYRNHYFDTEERARGKRKHKLGNVAKPEDPVWHPTTVREHHKAHEAKMLPHVRRGLNL